jgi:hypothetical protein
MNELIFKTPFLIGPHLLPHKANISLFIWHLLILLNASAFSIRVILSVLAYKSLKGKTPDSTCVPTGLKPCQFCGQMSMLGAGQQSFL